MPSVTKEDCDDRHGRVSMWMRTVMGLVGVLGLLAGWAILSGAQARQSASEVKSQQGKHEAAQGESDKAIRESLQRIERDQAATRALLDQVLRGNGLRRGVSHGDAGPTPAT